MVHRRVEALEEVMPESSGSGDLRKQMLSLGILDECQALMRDMSALECRYAVRCCRNAGCACVWCTVGAVLAAETCLQASTGLGSSDVCNV